MTQINFDPSQEKDAGFDPLPNGEYLVTVIQADLATPKSGDGQQLAVRFRVADGDYEGRLIFGHFALTHSNEMAQAIGRSLTKQLCVACGINKPLTDTDELLEHNVTAPAPFCASVTGESCRQASAGR
jgi:Protein of unknown function (DUF669)